MDMKALQAAAQAAGFALAPPEDFDGDVQTRAYFVYDDESDVSASRALVPIRDAPRPSLWRGWIEAVWAGRAAA